MPISVQEITKTATDTDGVFDALLRVISDQVEQEFRNGTLTPEQRSQVYIELAQNALTQSIQYVLQKPAADKQLEAIEAQIRVSDQQIQNLVAEKGQIAAQTIMTTKQGELVTQQVLNAEKELDVMQSGIDYQTNQSALITAQTDVQYKEALRTEKQIEILSEQKLKIGEEVSLLQSKVKTEDANHTGNPNGLIGKKIALYDAQITAFGTDAEIKRDEQRVKIFSIMRTAGDPIDPPADLYPPDATT